MSNIDKQAVQAVADLKAGYTLGHADVAILNELARIALASLEADASRRNPVLAYSDSYRDMAKQGVESIPVWSVITDLERNIAPLFTAPPAPVSVPDAMDDQGGVCCEVSYADGWNACRAAMLQGADGNAPAHFRSRPAQSSLSPAQGGNSPVIPDGWVACSERMPENDDFVYIWPRPDFGVELHVAQYGKFDKRDAGWYAQVYEQNYGIEYYPVKVTHWMPLPAAPQRGDSF